MNDLVTHFPVLLVVVPLLTAPLLVLIRHRQVVRLFALLAAAVTAVIGWGLVWAAREQTEPLSYQLGGWAPPVGIEYVVSQASALVAGVVSTIAFFALFLGCRETRSEVRDGEEHLFYAAYLLCLAGLLGMAITGDAFNVFVFLEISSLSSYALVAMGNRRRAFSAAFNYLILGTLGGTFVLIGVGLLYQITGTLNVQDIAQRVQAIESHAVDSHNRTLMVAFAFMVIGLGLKLAVFPLHQWLPGAYAEAPAAVSAFLAGTATKVIYFQLLRTTVVFFGAAHVFGTLRFGSHVLMPLSLAGMFVGSIAAVYQPTLKRMLAFSSVGQVGYLTLALSFGSEAGVSAGLLHLGAHALTKAGLFVVVAIVVAGIGSNRIHALAGLGRRMPLTAFAFVLGGVGLIGVPGTAGFVSKWALLQAAFAGHNYVVAGLILLSSLVAVLYVWRVVEVMYFRAPDADAPPVTFGKTLDDKLTAMAAWVLLGATVVFGLLPSGATELAVDAAHQLFAIPEAVAAPVVHGGHP